MTQRKRTTIDGRDTTPEPGRRRLRRRRIAVAAGLLAATVTLAAVGPTALIEARSDRARAKWAQRVNRPRRVTAPASPTTTTSTTTTTTSTTSTTVAPTTTVPVPTTVPSPPTTVPVPSAQTLWLANAAADVDRGDETLFWKKEASDDSRLSIVNDPTGRFGKVFRAYLTAADINSGVDRAEWRGSYVNGSKVTFGVEGQELWYGWRSMFGGNVALTGAENDGNYMQLKGDSSCGGPAVGFTIRYGRLSIRTIDGDYLAWLGPQMTSLLGSGWHDFVLHVRYAKPGSTGGFLELWMDGQRQAMTNGQLRVQLPTMCPGDSNVFWKLGTYGMDEGIGQGPVHWAESPRIGTTYAAAAPR